MATNEEIREGLADRLRTIDDLRVHERPPGEIVPDAAVIRRRFTNYDVTFDHEVDTGWGITVFVAFGNTDAGTLALDDYLSPAGAKSVAAAIHADPTLGGIVDYARVSGAEGETITAYAGVDYLSVEFTVDIGG